LQLASLPTFDQSMRPLYRFLSFTFILTLACNLATDTSTEPTAAPQSTAPVTAQSATEPAAAFDSTPAIAGVSDIFASGGPPGSSRILPMPPNSLITGQNWEATALEVVRGADAWQQLQAANPFNEPAPEDQEYLLLRLRLKITGSGSESYLIYPAVTGNRLIRYNAVAAVTPEPRLPGEFTAGQTAEGWLPYLVGQDEGNLLLVVRELNSAAEPSRYLALSEGASIAVPNDLTTLAPTDSGVEADAPTPVGQTATTEDWELTVLDVEVGDKAWQMVTHANQFNDPPPNGRQYAAVWLRLRYIGQEEEARLVYGTWFSGRSGSVIEETPSIIEPLPALDGVYLYPGAEVEGWVIITVSDDPGENLTLVFDPDTLDDTNRRFLALPSTGR
jgi:hypothetical protein